MRSYLDEVCRLGMYFDNVKALNIKNVSVEGAIGDQLIANHVQKIVK